MCSFRDEGKIFDLFFADPTFSCIEFASIRLWKTSESALVEFMKGSSPEACKAALVPSARGVKICTFAQDMAAALAGCRAERRERASRVSTSRAIACAAAALAL